MRAHIEPLVGKYYGTSVVIDEPGFGGGHINLWFATGIPSDRELQGAGLTREQWDSNAVVDDGWGGQCGCRDADFFCDSHYECQKTFEVAKAILAALEVM